MMLRFESLLGKSARHLTQAALEQKQSLPPSSKGTTPAKTLRLKTLQALARRRGDHAAQLQRTPHPHGLKIWVPSPLVRVQTGTAA